MAPGFALSVFTWCSRYSALHYALFTSLLLEQVPSEPVQNFWQTTFYSNFHVAKCSHHTLLKTPVGMPLSIFAKYGASWLPLSWLKKVLTPKLFTRPCFGAAAMAWHSLLVVLAVPTLLWNTASKMAESLKTHKFNKHITWIPLPLDDPSPLNGNEWNHTLSLAPPSDSLLPCVWPRWNAFIQSPRHVRWLWLIWRILEHERHFSQTIHGPSIVLWIWMDLQSHLHDQCVCISNERFLAPTHRRTQKEMLNSVKVLWETVHTGRKW